MDNPFLERGDLLLDRVTQPVDLLIKEVDVREDRADPQRVQMIEAALERLFERGQLRAQATLREFREHLGIGGAVHERVEHRPPGLPEDVGRDTVELDAGVLQRLVQPVGLPLAISDLGLAIPGQRAQPPLGLGSHEAAAQQAGLHQLAQPLRHTHPFSGPERS